jgi:putative membrane protein insertion efficiency factor
MGAVAAPGSALTRLLVAVLRGYQLALSPFLPTGTCRFFPSCSDYAIGALAREGALRGGARALRRVLRCTPLQRGGLDLP